MGAASGYAACKNRQSPLVQSDLGMDGINLGPTKTNS